MARVTELTRGTASNSSHLSTWIVSRCTIAEDIQQFCTGAVRYVQVTCGFTQRLYLL